MSTHTRRSIIARLHALLLALLLGWTYALGAPAAQAAQAASPSGAPSGSTCNVPSGGTYNYPTIQAAVNDAGCATINVAAGTYQENVKIERHVTINGAGASSTIVDGGRPPSGPITCPHSNDCTVFAIRWNGEVAFNGLTIRNGFNDNGPSGGIEIADNADVTVTSSILSNNRQAKAGACGGAIKVNRALATLTVDNSTFSGNLGSAICTSGVTTIRSSTFSGNRGDDGGAIVSYGDYLTIKNSTFTGNTGNRAALALYGDTQVINSTFSNNQAGTSDGGAIYVSGAIVDVSSSTLAGNSARNGGAIYIHNGYVQLKSSIIANNSATGAGGNCFAMPGYMVNDRGNNLVWGDATCPGNKIDPKLAALADNGGATQTMALQAGSAAIDNGNCFDVIGVVIQTDQRGLDRLQGYTCDIGAFESYGIGPREGLILRWKFDEGTGTAAYDSTGNGRTGTLKNGASFTNAALPALKFFNPFALNLKGTSHQYVDAERLDLTHASFTVAVWAKRSTTAGKQWIVSQGWRAMDRALMLGFRDNDRFTCAFYDDDLDSPQQYLDTNQWHHWACTWDAATRSRKLYRDGELVAFDTSKGMLQAHDRLNIGRAVWNEGYFSGALDDLRVYNRPLSAAEVQVLAAGN